MGVGKYIFGSVTKCTASCFRFLSSVHASCRSCCLKMETKFQRYILRHNVNKGNGFYLGTDSQNI